MKRVLHIFGAMNRGGAEMRTVSLMPEMNKKNVEFNYCVLSGMEGVLDDSIRKQGGDIYFCKLDTYFVFRFILLLRKEKFDIVHSHVAYVSGFILFLAWICGCPKRVAHFRNTTAGSFESKARIIRDWVLRNMITIFSTDILAVCKGAMDGFLGESWSSNRRCKVIYNGFEVPKIKSEHDFWLEYVPRYSGQKVILNVARMDAQKNHIRQCDIFNQLNQINKNTIMVFIGKEDADRKKLMLEKIIEYGLQDRVYFLGLQVNVLKFMRHADVMLFPSEWEGLPGVVLESLSVGLPVVGSDLPGIEEISERIEGVQIIGRHQSDGEWADRLLAVLNEQVDRAKIVQSFKLSEFLMYKNVQQLYAIYSE